MSKKKRHQSIESYSVPSMTERTYRSTLCKSPVFCTSAVGVKNFNSKSTGSQSQTNCMSLCLTLSRTFMAQPLEWYLVFIFSSKMFASLLRHTIIAFYRRKPSHCHCVGIGVRVNHFIWYCWSAIQFVRDRLNSITLLSHRWLHVYLNMMYKTICDEMWRETKQQHNQENKNHVEMVGAPCLQLLAIVKCETNTWISIE